MSRRTHYQHEAARIAENRGARANHDAAGILKHETTGNYASTSRAVVSREPSAPTPPKPTPGRDQRRSSFRDLYASDYLNDFEGHADAWNGT